MHWMGWWESQNWGTVPDWFAAVGTVGALLLGLFLLMRERAKGRVDVADSFVTWHVSSFSNSSDGSTTHGLQINAYNAGSGPVPVALIYSKPRVGPYIFEQLKRDTGFAAIQPSEKVEREISLDKEPDLTRVFIQFTDSHGHTWFRNLADKSYYSKRAVERRMKSRMPFKSVFAS